MRAELTESVLRALKMRPKGSLSETKHVDLVNGLAKAMSLQSHGDISAHPGYRDLIDLAELEQRSARVLYDRPEFLDAARVDALRAELKAHITLNRFETFATFSPTEESSPAIQLSRDPRFSASIAAYFGLPLKVSNDISYMVYQQQGDGRFPHLDIDLYAFNCLMILEHEAAIGQPSSKTCLFDRTGVRQFHLRPGEILSFNASAKLHSRSPLGPGEQVSLLTIGLTLEA